MRFGKVSSMRRAVLLGAAALALGACTSEWTVPKDLRPVPQKLVYQMKADGMSETSPILVRLFKEESKLEVWKQQGNSKYALVKTYDICKWSGVLGPKTKEGDRQAPEGFYTVTPAQMNPNSSYYLSFNIGYPNTYDKAYGRTGTNIMVHGACSSAGCYSMTDEDAGEIFALARDAFKGGQRQFQIQAFPFRMTPENFAKHRGDPNMEFWMNLKVGYDHFEVTRQAPTVAVCDKRYVFDADAGGKKFVATAPCPAYTVPAWIASAVAAKQAADNQKIAALSAKMNKDANQLAATKQKVADQVASEQADAAKEFDADAASQARLRRQERRPGGRQRCRRAGRHGGRGADPGPVQRAGAKDRCRTTGAEIGTGNNRGGRTHPRAGRRDHDRDDDGRSGATGHQRFRLAGRAGRGQRRRFPAQHDDGQLSRGQSGQNSRIAGTPTATMMISSGRPIRQ